MARKEAAKARQDKNNKEVLVSIFLRIGLAVVFLYAAVSSMLEPQNWIGFIPDFIKSIIPADIFLVLFSVYEFLLSLWLLSGRKGFYSAILSALTLAAIIFFNFTVLEIVFRDIAIFFAAIALAILSYKNKR